MPARDDSGPAGRTTGGFALLELMVAVAIIGMLLAIAIPTFAKSRVTARNNEMVAASLRITQAIARYNADWPIRPSLTGGPPYDALLNHQVTPANPYGGGYSGAWDGANYADSARGLVGPTAGSAGDAVQSFLLHWPRDPFGLAANGIRVNRSNGGGTPGTMLVERVAIPTGAFRVTAWGRDRSGASIVVMRKTVMASGAGFDCGAPATPPC